MPEGRGIYTILYVDDEPGLLEIGKLFLEQGGQFSVETVTSATLALEALRSGRYDAIISDYQMPGMDGIEFLKRVRSSGNTIPFIIFTGRGREQVVIQALNEGADFYLQKGGEPVSQFAELAHKVRQAVQQRLAEASIRDHERREADIINFLPDATFAIDTRGVVIAWNRAMETMTGVPAPEILGKGNYEYALPFYHERRPILIDLVLSEDPVTLARYPYVKHEGRTLFSEIRIPHFHEGKGAALWFTASPLYDTSGNIIGAIESIREITEWKRAEEALNESERRFRELADMLPQVVFEADEKGNLTYANHIAFELFGYTDDEFRHGLNVMQMITPEDRGRASVAYRAMLEGKGRTRRDMEEYLAQRKDGSVFPVAIYSSPVFTHGRITGLRGIIVDITDSRLAQDRIRESEQRYRNVVEDQTEFICRFRPDGTHVFVNEAYCRYFGLHREEIIGHGFRPDIPPEDRQRVKQFFASLSPDHPVGTIEHRIIMPDGSIRWQRWSDRAIFDTAGVVAEYQSVGRDTTEKKEAEEALRRSEGRYRILAGLLDLIPASVTVHDAEGRFLYANQKTFEYHGFTAEEFYRINLHELDVPDSEQLIEERVRELQEKGTVAFEVQHFRKDRSVIPLLVNAMITTWDGAPVILSIATDITERKKTEAALQQSEARYRILLTSVNEGIWVIDTEGCTTYVNQKMAEMLGYTVDEMTGSPMYRFMDERGREIAARNYPAYRKGVREQAEFEFVKKDGTRITTLVSNTSLFDPSGTFCGAMAAVTDITERKRTEQVIQEANRKISLLTSITRHDVANQVMALRGFANMARIERPGQVVAGLLEKIDSAASAIARQIEFTRSYQELSLHPLGWHKIRDVVEQQDPDGISLSCTCDAMVFADPMLERVFFNLVENVVRHGETVTAITVSCRPGMDDSLVITVADNGCGVPADIKEKIFEKGFGKHTGFGLFLAREVLAITGITIRETGTFGKGARFEITVPKGTYRFPS